MSSLSKSASPRHKPDRLVEARKLSGLSQLQAARVSKLSQTSIAEAESGDRHLSPEELGRFAKIYDVSILWLCGHTPDPLDHAVSETGLAARDIQKLAPDQFHRLLHLLAMLPRDPEPDSSLSETPKSTCP